MKADVRDVLFWIFLVISMILLIWSIFGESPTEFIALAGLMFTILFKLGSVSERQVRLETRFNILAKDFKEHINKEVKNG